MPRKGLLALVALATAIGGGAVGAHLSSATAARHAGLLPQCSNRIDDDHDGYTDLADPGCSGPLDDSEYNAPLPACSNGRDDDGDGKVDMKDPGCSGPLDDSEYNPPPPQCSNGKDDDGDGKVDLHDPGCSGPQDNNERNSAPPPPPPPPPPGGGKGHLPHEFFGLAEGGNIDARDYARMEEINVGSLRVSLSWRAIEPRPGHFVWPDRYVAWLATYGIRPTFLVYPAPQWATGSAYPGVPPLSGKATRAWKKFLKQAVLRYGPNGSFWRENPGLPEEPAKSWEIWNEPNLKKYFARVHGDSVRMVKKAPRAYAHLIKSADKAISHVDKHANVVVGGLTTNPKHDNMLPWRFLKKFLKVHGIKRHFTAVALHPYAPTAAKFEGMVKRTRKAMRKGGAGGKDLWLTEVGWGSANDKHALTKGKRGQAKILRKTFKFMAKERSKLNISRVFWFYWRDPTPGGPSGCSFCDSSGLLNFHSAPKPSYRDFKHFALRQRRQ
jgi:hypothetical protein